MWEYQKLNLTMRVEQRKYDYALFLNRWVIRSYKEMPSEEELSRQETAILQTINAYQETLREYEKRFIMDVEWEE